MSVGIARRRMQDDERTPNWSLDLVRPAMFAKSEDIVGSQSAMCERPHQHLLSAHYIGGQ